MGSVSGKVVLITGGDAGVGAEVARRLHAKGAKLLLTDVDADALAAQLAALGDDRVLTVDADVRDLGAMEAAVEMAVRRFGGVDVVVANAVIAEMLSKMPGPLGKTTSVQDCGAAFVSGIEGRKSRVYCPGWVGALRWLKTLMSTRLGEAPVRRFVADLIPRMDAEVAALGRSTSAHSEGMAK